MNMFLAYIFFILFLVQLSISQQNTGDNFIFESDPDYLDFPIPQKSSFKPAKKAMARSPAIASTSPGSKVFPTPVPILKQINRHNKDGSYTFGFEGADGSFKIETKLASGEVVGKYGYVDDTGKVRIVEYGANKYGFQPSGEGITIPPVNIGNESEMESKLDRVEGEDRKQYVVRPNFRTSSGPSTLNRKSHKPVHFYPRGMSLMPQTTPQYYFHEQDVLKGNLGTNDVSSLQVELANNLKEAAARHQDPHHPNPSPAVRYAGDPAKTERLLTLPIHKVFENRASSAMRHQFSYPSYVPFEVPERPGIRASKNQVKPKVPPQFLIVGPDQNSSQTFKRSSNRQTGQGRSILDDLIQQYVIPNRSPATHDFSFGFN